MKNLFIISEEEKKRILVLHKSETKKQYISEQQGNIFSKLATNFKTLVNKITTYTKIPEHIKIFLQFLNLRTTPITEKDFSDDMLKTMLSMINKRFKKSKKTQYVNFTSDVNFKDVIKGAEKQIHIDKEKQIGYILGNSEVTDNGSYYTINDLYDFNNFKNDPEKYLLKNLPSTVSQSIMKLFDNNLVQGVEELASYYHKMGYKGIPVNIKLNKNL